MNTIAHHRTRYALLALAAILLAGMLTKFNMANAQSLYPDNPIRLQFPGVDLPIVDQAGVYDAVTRRSDAVTLFEAPLAAGVTGLIAHNDLAGGLFYQVQLGDRLSLQYQGGRIVHYRIREIRQFQSLGAAYPYYEFRDLQTGLIMTDVDVYDLIYDRPGTLILQTCLSRGSKADWGLTFWIAYPDPGIVQTNYLPAIRR